MSFCNRFLIPVFMSLMMGWLSSGLARAQEQAAASNTPGQTTGSSDSNVAADDGRMHVTFTGYLWAPGIHGTLGSHGYDAGVRASPSQLLSHFHLGLMGATEIRKKRLLGTIDFMWVNLSRQRRKSYSVSRVPTISAKAGFNQIILTPKVGFRVINNQYFTIDGLAGIRYWNLGGSLEFTPPPLGGKRKVSRKTRAGWIRSLVCASRRLLTISLFSR